MPYADQDTAREYQRDYRRMQRAGDCTIPSTARLPAEFRLRRAADVIALLEEQIDAVRAETEAGTLEKARCIGYLASVALKAIEAGDVAVRLEALESALKMRKENTP
jgi:hypothetical protein